MRKRLAALVALAALLCTIAAPILAQEAGGEQPVAEEPVGQIRPLLVQVRQQVPVSVTVAVPVGAGTETVTLPLLLDLDLQLGLADSSGAVAAVAAAAPVEVSVTDAALQRVYLVRSTGLYDKPGGSAIRNYPLGSELAYLGSDEDGWYAVRGPDGAGGWVRSGYVDVEDPRTLFTVQGRQTAGYLLWGPDVYSGVLSRIDLEDTLFGKVTVPIDQVAAIRFVAGDAAEPVRLETVHGDIYAGTIARYGSSSAFIHLIVDGIVIRFEALSDLTLVPVGSQAP